MGFIGFNECLLYVDMEHIGVLISALSKALTTRRLVLTTVAVVASSIMYAMLYSTCEKLNQCLQ